MSPPDDHPAVEDVGSEIKADLGDGSGLQVRARFARGDFELDLDLQVAPGEILGVLGPNGAGKTTLLRILAGLDSVTTGRITLDGQLLDDSVSGRFRPANERPVALVFQNYRLFPHLSVRDNVAFAPRSQGLDRRAARALAQQWLDRLGLSELTRRKPGQLSGGQAQRVALARALAAGPRLLLLDEPLAALDARTRLDVRAELRRYLRAFDGATLFITHDPLEAMVMTDRLIVLERGRIVQQGTPAAVARRPATQYVARLVGLNLYPGILEANGRIALTGGGTLVAATGSASEPGFGMTDPGPVAGDPVLVAIRPTALSLHVTKPGGASPRNVWPGTVTGLELLTDRVRVEVAGTPSALVDITADAVAELDLAEGTPVWLSAKATEVDLYPEPNAPTGNQGSAAAR